MCSFFNFFGTAFDSFMELMEWLEQLTQRQVFPHYLPFLKHSQYFFTQLDFLQLQPSPEYYIRLESARENAKGSLVMISFMTSDLRMLSVLFRQESQRQLYIKILLLHCTYCRWRNTRSTSSSNDSSDSCSRCILCVVWVEVRRLSKIGIYSRTSQWWKAHPSA